MNTEHPFLDDRFEINWSKLTPEHVQPDIELALQKAQEAVDAIAGMDPAQATYANAILGLEKAVTVLGDAWIKVDHLSSVCDSKPLREALNAMLPKVSEFQSGIYLNDRLWKVVRAAAEHAKGEQLTPVQQRFAEETVKDFVEAGADLPPEKKKRYAEIQKELSQITQKFSENTLDSTNAWELVIDDEARLSGLPPSAREAARLSAERKGQGSKDAPKWRFTLHAPSMMPVLQYADDEALRRDVWEAFSQIGRKGDWDNTALVARILELRAEKAALMGKANFGDLVLERRMAKSGADALKFVENLHDRIKPAFIREVEEVEAFKAEQTGQPQEHLEPWELAYWSEKLRKARFDFDEEELRPYFPLHSVINGMFRITERLFGLRISERTGDKKPDVWHEDVHFYDIFDAADGRHLGSFYSDWHPREPKRSGAWMNGLSTGETRPGSSRDPHLGLVCGNMTEPQGDKPALLTHREVETVFHEFGHLLHHVLSDAEVRSLSGTSVPWDFVELPSQIMENWCWERESLDLFARHHETGEPIPQPLFEKMLAARQYGAARFAMRQLSFGKIDLELHVNYPKYKGRDLDEVSNEVQADYLIPTKTPSRNNLRAFGHLFSSPVGYAAGYYSYKWAEVLDADAFTRFLKEGVMNAETGMAFRKNVLAMGNSRDVALSFREFMGRDPDPEALLVREGLAQAS